MSFPGQFLQLQVIERRDSTDRVLAFLRIKNNADIELATEWRLYFSLGLAPDEAETRVNRTIVDGRYGYLEPAAGWHSLQPGQDVEIPIKNWLFTHMPAQARQGFHLLSWRTSPDEGSLSLPECLPPALLDITSMPNASIRDLSPSCDVTPDSAEHRYNINKRGFHDNQIAIIPAPDQLIITGDRFKFRGFDFDNSQLAKVLRRLRGTGGLPVNVEYVTDLEGYTLSVTESCVDIRSGSEESTYHAAHTLRQLISSEDLLHPCQLSDNPDFEHRGLFIDIARHFHGIADLKNVIQAMAAYPQANLVIRQQSPPRRDHQATCSHWKPRLLLPTLKHQPGPHQLPV